MKTHLIPLCAALFLLPSILLLPSTAEAAPAEGDTWIDSDEGARVTQRDNGVREVVIEDGDDVTGVALKPGGVKVRGVHADKHASMITIRGAFTTELISLSLEI